MRAKGNTAPRRSAETDPDITRLAGKSRVLQKNRLVENILRGGKLIVLRNVLLLQPRFGEQTGKRNFRIVQRHVFLK